MLCQTLCCQIRQSSEGHVDAVLSADHIVQDRLPSLLDRSVVPDTWSDAFERVLPGISRHALAVRPRNLAVSIRQGLEEAIPRRRQRQETEGQKRFDSEKPAFAEAILSM